MPVNRLFALFLRQQRLFQILFLLALAIVSWTCLIPLDGPIMDVKNIDKVFHFIAYFGLAALLERALPNHFIYKGLLSLIGYGIFIELLQGQTEYRSASFADFIANSSGALTYLLMQPLILKLSQSPQHNNDEH